MGLTRKQLERGLDATAAKEYAIAEALVRAGYPNPRIRDRGYATLLRTIVGQQVSVASATSIWSRLEDLLGEGCSAQALHAKSDADLRGCGLSRQKQSYARSLAECVLSGDLDFSCLPQDTEAAIELLTRVKGIGRWSAEIYLLFAEGRPDIWPAGDLAIQEGIGRILGLPERPSEKQTRALSEAWAPHRGAVAIFTWHYYNTAAL